MLNSVNRSASLNQRYASHTKNVLKLFFRSYERLLAHTKEVFKSKSNLQLATRPDAPEALQQLVEIARNPTASSSALPAGKDDSIRQQKDKKVANQPAASREDSNVPESSEPDSVGFHEQVSQLFAEWYRIYELPGVNDQLCARFVLQLQQLGLLKADDTSDRFFRRLLDIAVSHCLSSEGAVHSHQQTQTLSFLAIDMYTSLVFSILKIDLLAEISQSPRILSEVDAALKAKQMKSDVDEYLKWC